MKIKRLRLTGFKSFVEPAELRIEPGLTGVVGPNGCGKSNLLEAIRWVMGENSPKSMRGGGMDDVIFAGTSSRPPRDFAEIGLVADLEGATLTSIGDADSDGELEVVRRIERGQGSAYRANGRDVRAKDIALIFADAATGAHSPALVSQGKIAAVISAKPAERRQMLEEAAGIAGLHVRRKDAEQKLRATEANLERLDQLIGDMAQRAGQLRRQARAAERYQKLSDQIRVAEGRMIYARWRDAAAAADRGREDAENAGHAVRSAQEAQEAVSAYRAEADKTLASRREAAREADQAASSVAQKLARMSAEAEAHERRATDIADQLQRIVDDRGREGSLAEQAAATIERLAAEAATLADALDQTEAKLPALAETIHATAATLRDVEVELAQLRADIAGETADRRIAEAEFAAAKNVFERIERELATATGQRAEITDKNEAAARLADATARYESAANASASAELALSDGQKTLETAIAGRQDADRGAADAHAALASMASEAAALERAVQSEAGDDRALDRIKVAKGYEQAMAAALGDDLQAPIGGSAGWIGSDDAASDPDLPPGTECLADHVAAPAALKRRLRQIAVVAHDEGQGLAIGQRLVTLDGTLRRWDGFTVREGAAFAAEQLVRRNRIETIGQELPGLERAAEQASAAAGAASRRVTAAEQTLAEARRQRSSADEAHRSALRDADEARAEIDRQSERAATLDARIAELAERIDAAMLTRNTAQQKLDALPEAGRSAERLTATETRADNARQVARQAREAEQEIKAELARLRERKAGIAAEQKGWQARAGEATQRIAQLAERHAMLEAERDRIGETPDALRADIAKLETAQAELAARRDIMRAEEAGAERDLAENEEQLASAREALSAARETRAGAEARAEAQELRRIEMGRVSNERFECPPPLLPQVAEFDDAEVGDPQAESHEHERLNGARERIGPVNLVAAQELEELDGDHDRSAGEAEELRQAVAQLRGSIGSLNREGRARLRQAFSDVDTHFQRLFTTLFNGGAAHLALVDSDDPLEAGLEIMAQPPGKKLSTLTLLSGGEQALTAIALIFALFLTNPAPICVLDEVDAPLDDANIERFCDLLDTMTRQTKTRYLIVTHNAVTMSRMHRLFGVTMVEQGVSRLVSVDLEAAEELVAA